NYDPLVRRSLRTIAAVALALAVATVPLVADWCAVACEATHAPAAPAAACHHAPPAAPTMGRVPAPCGQDHHPVVVDAAATRLAGVRAVPVLACSTAAAWATQSRSASGDTRPDRRCVHAPSLTLALAASLRL